jgi:hypothetical protein
MTIGATNPRLRERRVVASSLDPAEPLSERLVQMRETARRALADPFVGVTTDGRARSGLFPIRRTGVPTDTIADAATAFLASLTAEQRATASFDVESEHWRAWHNVHPNLMRHGLCLDACTADQRALALAIVRESMSSAGFALATGVMKLNDYLGEISGRTGEFAEWYYWLSVFGAPSATEPWGWQIDGHHLIVNAFVLGDQLVLTPNFIGSEPVVATSGKHAGTRVFDREEAVGIALMDALTPAQRARATIGAQMPSDVFGRAASDNIVLPQAGIRYDDLSPAARERLMDIIITYVGRIRDDHAGIKLAEVNEHLAETTFAWIGAFGDGNPFYYRVQSPVILIEFDHQPGVAYENAEPSHNHIHTLVRTPNGNDYGRDLLRAHYERFDHSHPDTPHRRGLA